MTPSPRYRVLGLLAALLFTITTEVAAQVRRLIDLGVVRDQIVVMGCSKGGTIAVLTSHKLSDSPVRYVFLAACAPSVLNDSDIEFSGKVLAVIEASDEIGPSCAPAADRSHKMITYQKLVIETGLRHGAFYQPLAVWLEPVSVWLGGA